MMWIPKIIFYLATGLLAIIVGASIALRVMAKRERDGKIFKLSEMEPGQNAAPMHPNCKCSTAAAMDREELEKGRRDWDNGERD